MIVEGRTFRVTNRDLALLVTIREVSAFRNLLVSFKPVPTPSLAAPGLSLHGRMQAVDFQVMAGNRIVAGTDASSVIEVWETRGWKAKLQSAVNEANAGFVGRLKNPNEPWHRLPAGR